MRIYQGEPLGFKFNIKGDNGEYYPSLEGMHFEALLADCSGNVVKTWSTKEGSISIGIETVEGEPRGYASFAVSGHETSRFEFGEYVYEMANVLEGKAGRAIGKLKGKIFVDFALIKKGV